MPDDLLLGISGTHFVGCVFSLQAVFLNSLF